VFHIFDGVSVLRFEIKRLQFDTILIFFRKKCWFWVYNKTIILNSNYNWMFNSSEEYLKHLADKKFYFPNIISNQNIHFDMSCYWNLGALYSNVSLSPEWTIFIIIHWILPFVLCNYSKTISSRKNLTKIYWSKSGKTITGKTGKNSY